MARILADENIPPTLAQALRAFGHDLRTVHDLRLQGATDEAVLEGADKDGRILLTADKDFGLVLELGPLAGKGKVILIRFHILDWSVIARELEAAIRATEAEFAGGPALLVVVSEGQYRMRRWSGTR